MMEIPSILFLFFSSPSLSCISIAYTQTLQNEHFLCGTFLWTLWKYSQEYFVKLMVVFLQNCTCFQSIPVSSQTMLLRYVKNQLSPSAVPSQPTMATFCSKGVLYMINRNNVDLGRMLLNSQY